MNIVLETNIQSVSTGTIRDSPIGPDVYQPLSMNKMLVHKRRYVYKRLRPSNNNTKPAIELYVGRATPHIEEITITGEGGTLTAIYEKADEVMEHTRRGKELPSATIVQFTQTIQYVPPSDIDSSQAPTTPLEETRPSRITVNPHFTPGSSSSTLRAIKVEAPAEAGTQAQARALQPLSIASRPKRSLPSRTQSQTGARTSRRKNIASDDNSCLTRKRRREDDDDDATSLNEDVSAKSKRRRLVMLGVSVMGIGFEFCGFEWDILS
ncbi:hypothetical protein BJ912DRAFT_921724 [Pholiota molesta]|nr:hypothetical protein BJ912DRAFT_921724 [Pholiota molesta]